MRITDHPYFRFANLRNCLMIILAVLIISCRGGQTDKETGYHDSDNQIVKYAKGFKIIRHDNYSEMTVMNPWQGADGISMVCYLVKRDRPVPPDIPADKVIFVPVRTIVCMSTTHVGMITALGETHSVTGISTAGYAYSNEIAARVKQGMISEVGYETSLNHEMIIKLSPDLLMMYGIGSESAGHVNKLNELGINIVFNGDYLETDPLAKAEWIKMFGALYCKEEMADSIYNKEVNDYNSVREYVKTNSVKKPVVLLGLPFKDTWFISPGNSFVSKLIEDAGGNYLWKNTNSSTSMPYGLENVYIAAMNADFWLNIGTVTNSDEISLVDKRLADLTCYRNGNLYNNNRRITETGGNDYWESGAMWPHLILKDVASILHPGLFPEHELYYYRKVN